MSFKLFKKKDPQEDKTPNLTEGWTNGQRLISLGVSGALWAALLSGPAALAFAIGSNDSEPKQTELIQDAGITQKVAEYGSSFMRVYLTQGREDSSLIAPFLSEDVSLPRWGKQAPLNIVAVMPGRVKELSPGRWIVDVAVDLIEAEDKPVVHRYYQVPVVTSEKGEIAVVALPSLVSAPVNGEIEIDQPEEIRNKELQTTVENFFNAYLAGKGKVDPLLAPGVSISTPEPTPFSEVQILSVRSFVGVPDEVKDGSKTRLYVSIQAVTGDNSSEQFDYVLDLRYRERWEVSALNKEIPVLKEKKND